MISGLLVGLFTVMFVVGYGKLVTNNWRSNVPTSTAACLRWAVATAVIAWVILYLTFSLLGWPTYEPLWMVGDALGLFIGYTVADQLIPGRRKNAPSTPKSSDGPRWNQPPKDPTLR